jgi:isoleucyl-tRNA synthetase
MVPSVLNIWIPIIYLFTRDDFLLFKPNRKKHLMVGNSQKHFLADTEEDILETWQKEKTFEKSLESRKDGPRFNFYDGPPFANGIPHYGHLEQTTIKDTVTRYKTMRG